MGASCCKKEPNLEEVPYESTLNYCGIEIIFKRAQANRENADLLVMSTDNFISNRSTTIIEEDNILQSINTEIKKIRGDNDSPLQNGDVVFSNPGLLQNIKEIAHLTVPIWRGGSFQEEQKITNGFLEILKQCEEKKMSTILFTDITSGRFGIPRQIGYSALLNAIKQYLTSEKKSDQITTIKFVHKAKSNVILFEDFFKKNVGMKDRSADSMYSDHLKFAYSPEVKQNLIEPNPEMSGESQQSNLNKEENIQ